MKKTFGSIIAITLIIGTFSFIFIRSAFAENTKGLTVTPVQYEFTMIPGEQKDFTGTVKNNSKEKISLTLEFASINIEALINEDRFQLEEGDDPKSPDKWLSSDARKVIIQPGKEKNISFRLKVPEDAELKGYYPAIIYQPQITSGPSDEVQIDEKIVSLVLLNIAEVKGSYAVSSGRINLFSSVPSVVFTPHVTFNIDFENTGQTYMHPRGKIHIFDRKGMYLSDTPTVNDDYEILLQGKDLTEEVRWNIKDPKGIMPPFGKYKAILEIYHNPDQGKNSLAETTFFVIPLWSILILIGIILFLIGMFFIGRHIKRHYL